MTVVKWIGVGGGLNVTPDYTDINSWDSYLNALGTFTEDQVGRVLWASSANELVVTVQQIFDGSTPSTFRIYLEAGDADGNQGGSFRDNANKATNALRYNASNGSGIRSTVYHGPNNAIIALNDDNITLQYMQIKNEGAFNRVINSLGATGDEINNCIIHQNASSDGGDATLTRKVVYNNCVVIVQNAVPASIGIYNSIGTNCTITNCTIVRTAAAGTSMGVRAGYDPVALKNVAVFGFNTDAGTSSGGSFTGSYNATDKSSGASGLPATNAQYDLVGSTEWESVTADSEDFRLQSTSAKCKDNGTDSGAPSTDIVDQARPSGSAFDIGAWEFQVAAAAPSDSGITSLDPVVRRILSSIISPVTLHRGR